MALYTIHRTLSIVHTMLRSTPNARSQTAKMLLRIGRRLDEPEGCESSTVQNEIAEALGDPTTRIAMFCLIAERILRQRLDGKDEQVIATWLVVRVGVAADRTAQILGMAADASHAAADVDKGADFDTVVDRIVGSNVAERPFAAAMVHMALDVLKSETARLDRRDMIAHLMARLGVDEQTIDGVLEIVRDVLAKHAAGVPHLPERLASDRGMAIEHANALVEQILLARSAALRIREGWEVPTVFRELGLEHAVPQILIVALRLVDEMGDAPG